VKAIELLMETPDLFMPHYVEKFLPKIRVVAAIYINRLKLQGADPKVVESLTCRLLTRDEPHSIESWNALSHTLQAITDTQRAIFTAENTE
jgi:hypothetical protein